ncbi:MAG: hypothetical protein ACOZDD_00655 [Bacteroidota bacterium]
MNRRNIYSFMAFLLFSVIVLTSCTEEMSEVRLDPKLSTTQLMNVTSDSATVVGFVVAQGDGFTERGICYNTSPNPTINDKKVAYTGELKSAAFSIRLGGLNYATKYYARAYAINPDGVIYGEEQTFTTLPVVPGLTTTAITAITGNSASGGGNVTIGGGAEVTVRGICFSTTNPPTIADSKTTDDKGTGAFTSQLTGLKGNTTYYVRAYATNSAGTGYGPVVTFKTLVDLPVVTTTPATAITKTSAASGGVVSYDGGAEVTERGIVWGRSAEPTVSDNKITAGTGTGAFVSSLTGLELFTTYHVRAYAMNSAGVAYGSNIQFTTLANTRTWNIPGDYVEASYPGLGLANWSPDRSPQVMSTVSAPDHLEGYVYMANSSNQWKFATQNNWDGPNYGGRIGVLDPSGDNYNLPKGYYKINANAADMTFTAIATEWGVIGDATPKGWDDETPLTYYPALKTWRGGIHLKAAQFKFRANHSWDYNYGSSSGNEKLNAGGDNIPVGLEADYYIILDLSKPNEYTYSANRWGLIGDATPGGWGTDTDMTWDPVNKVLKITLDLVAGSFKFRANDSWDYNLGGDLNNLTPNGDNIPVASPGNYTITLDLSGSSIKSTVTKN